MRPSIIRRLGAALTVFTLVLGGCGFDPAGVPVPGSRIDGDSYTVHVEFSDALNLPLQAKVFTDGVQVGTVTDIVVVDKNNGDDDNDDDHNHAMSEAGPGFAVAEVELLDSVRIPDTAGAELRQQTLLGDIHVELTVPEVTGVDMLGEGSRIPLERTRSLGQVEDSMATLAMFINGGAVTSAQDIVAQLNSAMPRDPAQTRRVADSIASNADDLATNLDDVDVFLDGMSSASQQAADSAPLLADILTEVEVEQLVNAVSSLIHALGLFGRIAEISRSLTWLAPTLDSADAAARAVMPLLFTSRPFDVTQPSNFNHISGLLRNRIIPWFEFGPKMDVRAVTVNGAEQLSADEQTEHVIRTLRMIGVVQ